MNTKEKKRGMKRWYAIGLLVCIFALPLMGQSCLRRSAAAIPPTVTITIWRSEDAQSDFQPAMDAYKAQFPQVNFVYRTLRPEEYQQALFEAWSRGEGPDIFSVPNNAVGRFEEFISPMPAGVTLPRAFQTRSFGRTVTTVENVTNAFTAPVQLRDRFPSVVADDVVRENQIFGLPLSVDTLVLYYNRDLLAKSQIATSPRTWEDFRNAAQALTRRDQQKNILQSAVPMGTPDNVSHFFDILSLIMIQNGAQMVAPNGQVNFASATEGRGQPAIEAVDFYSKFADDRFQTYTWNKDQPNGFEAFTQGTTAMVFGYASDKETIVQRAPNLNLGMSEFPQIDTGNPVNYANYNVETVHIGSPVADHAWNFIHTISMTQETAETFSTTTGHPPALLSLIGRKQQDVDFGVFARQALTARTWYHGRDPQMVVSAFQDMVRQVNERTSTIEELLLITAEKTRASYQDNVQ